MLDRHPSLMPVIIPTPTGMASSPIARVLAEEGHSMAVGSVGEGALPSGEGHTAFLLALMGLAGMKFGSRRKLRYHAAGP